MDEIYVRVILINPESNVACFTDIVRYAANIFNILIIDEWLYSCIDGSKYLEIFHNFFKNAW